MNERRFSVGDMGWPLAIAPALVVLVLGAFLIFATDSEPKRVPSSPDTETPLTEAPLAPGGAWITAKEAQTLAAVPLVAARHDGQDDIAGPHPGDPHEPWMHPHPITAEHKRIQAVNEAIQNLNDAMALRDTGKMRELILTHRALDPNDTDRAQLGYGIIADCIEHPGDASLARAKDFYANERHSPLRRFVRRICFEHRD